MANIFVALLGDQKKILAKENCHTQKIMDHHSQTKVIHQRTTKTKNAKPKAFRLLRDTTTN